MLDYNLRKKDQLLPPSDDKIFKNLMTRPEATNVLKALIESLNKS
jgi:hypothetical protein